MSKKRRSWTSLITDNFALKLISLLCALGFYAFIHSAQNAQRTVAVKLVVEKPDESVTRRLMSDIPASVDVAIVGPLQQIEQLRPESLAITLNLQAAQSIPELKLLPEMVNGLPPRVRAERVQPSRLKIRFEEIVTREIRVQVARTGEPAEDMEVTGKISIEPNIIAATGIESAVSTLQYARAETFDVSGLSEGRVKRRLKLDDPPENVMWSQDSVAASVQVSRKMTSKEFSGLDIELIGMGGLKVRPTTVTVKIEGPPDKVEAIRKASIVPKVDPRKAGADLSQPGSADVPVIVDIPNVTITVIPPTVFVKWGGA
jgi:YbbR domain-containing protein